jgi:hypothetical protein
VSGYDFETDPSWLDTLDEPDDFGWLDRLDDDEVRR